jgi:predicted secreted protein
MIASVLFFPSCTKRHYVEISCDQFTKNNNYTSEMNIGIGDMITVALCSNPTTGFEWSEEISDDDVIKEIEHEFLPPEGNVDKPPVAGAAGLDKWVYESMNDGMSTILFEYSQPWPGGIKKEWTYELTLVVESSE